MNVALPDEMLLLAGTAATIGFVHTLLGPDHYVPFVMMGRARRWSLAKTALITAACGMGHVLSSVLLGSLGIALGLAATRLEAINTTRGDLAAWGLIAFGATYFVWGLRRAFKAQTHTHWHEHSADTVHKHPHNHQGSHTHVHDTNAAGITPWVLFIIFVFGPCESLIPILMYPAAKSSLIGLLLVTGTFGITTLVTMVGAVLILSWGTAAIPTGRLERYTHACTGAAILLCGLAIRFLGV